MSHQYKDEQKYWYITYNVRNVLSGQLRLNLHNTFVFPYLHCSNTVWESTYRSDLNSVHVLQKPALKVAQRGPRDTPTANRECSLVVQGIPCISYKQIAHMYRHVQI